MLKTEEHEKHINDLSEFLKLEGIDQSKVSTILQGLRDNYIEVTTSIADSTKKLETTNKMNEDLRSANMLLFSKLGTPPATPNATTQTPPDGDTVKSLDALAQEFLK